MRFGSGTKWRQQHSASAQQYHSVLLGAATTSLVSTQSISLQSESSKLIPANRRASLESTHRLPAMAGNQHVTNTIVYVKHPKPVLPDVVVATKRTDSVTHYS